MTRWGLWEGLSHVLDLLGYRRLAHPMRLVTVKEQTRVPGSAWAGEKG